MVVLADFDIGGQVVVAGAGRGIGRALAIDLAASKATVVACSLDDDEGRPGFGRRRMT